MYWIAVKIVLKTHFFPPINGISICSFIFTAKQPYSEPFFWHYIFLSNNTLSEKTVFNSNYFRKIEDGNVQFLDNSEESVVAI